MDQPFDRRRFLQSALALGSAFGCALSRPVRASTSGRVVLGFQVPASFHPLLEGILVGLQGLYQPNLGKQPIMIPGASGALAVDAVLRAPSDGSTALIAPSAFLTLLPAVRQLADDPVNRLLPVAGIGETTVGFIVGAAVPSSVRTMADYFVWVRANPMQANYAVPGLGTAMHFVAREVSRAMDVPLKAVNYKGPQPIIEDVAAGAVAAAFTVVPDLNFATVHPSIRLLAVASDQRWPAFPHVPTFMELKLMEAPALESLGFLFAEGTPTAKVDELAAAVRIAAGTPGMLRIMEAMNMRPMPATRATYGEVLSEERKGWARLAKRVGTDSR